MACLVHDSHYRSLFHAVVNELRNEKCTPVSVLRNMPHQCCTCKKIDNITVISVTIEDKEHLRKLHNLSKQIEQNKETNPKLILALNHLENYIEQNRNVSSRISTNDPDVVDIYASCSESEDEQSKVIKKRKTKKRQKRSKPFKKGIFLFLPYKFINQPKSNLFIEAARKLQRGRFLGRNKYIDILQSAYNVHINMLTSTTSEHIKKTLNNAKAGIGDVKIHNQEVSQEEGEENGEWIFIHPKKNEDKIDYQKILEELINRWNKFLNLQKRKREDSNDEFPNKK